MGRYLNVGNAGFQSVKNGIYVDKSELIAFINKTIGTSDKLTCVSRPRRFGKSFAAKMLSAYYDKSCDSRKLFQNLKISEDPSFEKYLNRYNVLFAASYHNADILIRQVCRTLLNVGKTDYFHSGRDIRSLRLLAI